MRPPGTEGNSGWAEEESLDLDMVSAQPPKCKIFWAESNATTVAASACCRGDRGAAGAKFISNSWGGAEFEHGGVSSTSASSSPRGRYRGGW